MALVCLCRGNFYWPPHTTILFCSIFLDKIVLDTLKSRYHRSAPLGMPNQSGDKNVRSNKSSKRGSPYLRKTLFNVMGIYLKCAPQNEPVFQFLDRKRSDYFDLGFGHNRENVAVEMHRAALVFGVREHLAHSLQHPHALVADNELYLFCASIAVIRPSAS